VRRALLVLGAVVLPVALALTTSAIVRVSDPADAGILPGITTTTSFDTVPATPGPGSVPTVTDSPDGSPASPGVQASGAAQHPTTRPTEDSGGGSGSGQGSGRDDNGGGGGASNDGNGGSGGGGDD
jgi:uncharacterized membrane protein YgcG